MLGYCTLYGRLAAPAGTEGNASNSSESSTFPEPADETDISDIGLSIGELDMAGKVGVSSNGTGGIGSETPWRTFCSIRRQLVSYRQEFKVVHTFDKRRTSVLALEEP
jgi:hypothetical protein